MTSRMHLELELGRNGTPDYRRWTHGTYDTAMGADTDTCHMPQTQIHDTRSQRQGHDTDADTDTDTWIHGACCTVVLLTAWGGFMRDD